MKEYFVFGACLAVNLENHVLNLCIHGQYNSYYSHMALELMHRNEENVFTVEYSLLI